jgi:hypothetical protein
MNALDKYRKRANNREAYLKTKKIDKKRGKRVVEN